MIICPTIRDIVQCIRTSGGVEKTLFYTTLPHNTLGDILDNTMEGDRVRQPTQKMLQLMQERGRASDGSDSSDGSDREMKVIKKAWVVGGAWKTHAHEKPKRGAKEKPKAKTKGKEKARDLGGAPGKGKKGASRARSDEDVIDLVGEDDDDEEGEEDKEESGADDDDSDAAGVSRRVECQYMVLSNLCVLTWAQRP